MTFLIKTQDFVDSLIIRRGKP